MAKVKSLYSCQSCGHSSSKWLGRCPTCAEWNSFVEEKIEKVSAREKSLGDFFEKKNKEKVIKLLDPTINEHSLVRSRYLTGLSELDRVLGGGLVQDSFILLGGDPGIGKSTILLQCAEGLLRQAKERGEEFKILYVSGEESFDQIRARARRLGLPQDENIYLATEVELEKVYEIVSEMRPQVLFMDSLQTFYTKNLESAPGSVSQVREVAARLMNLAKTQGICIWLVGHVTKEGMIAGPKVVEHMVDTVLYFEGESGQSFRLLRTVKNRFGAIHELGVFEMESNGLKEVKNPSALFMNERATAIPGTAMGTTIEGTRTLLVELQALVSPTTLALPRRTTVGMDHNRIALLAAILERHLGVTLSNQDLFFNVVGGLRLSEPACDFAAAVAIYTSFTKKTPPNHSVFIGELGLTGEMRRVAQAELRVEEAEKLGFENIYIPDSLRERMAKKTKANLISIKHIRELESLI